MLNNADLHYGWKFVLYSSLLHCSKVDYSLLSVATLPLGIQLPTSEAKTV